MTDNLAQTIKLQQFASDPKNSSWVFASAGSGKTKVLTDRVLRLLLDNVAPDKILCLTFTKVAATEMQNRINGELAKWVVLDDLELAQKLFDLNGFKPKNSDLKKARILFASTLDAEGKIKIQTIHSFCQSLVKIFPFESGIKPNFEVLEEIQEKLLLQKAEKAVLKNCVLNSELKNLVTKINSKLHEESFSELLSDLLNKKEQLTILKENLGNIDGIIEAIFKKFAVEKNHSETEIADHFFKQIDFYQLSNLALNLEQSGSTKNLESADRIKKFLPNPDLKNFSFYRLAFFTGENEPRKFYGKIASDADFIKCVTNQINLISDFSDQINSLRICNSTALLLKFTDAILENYTDLKSQNALLDYNDLIVETNRLLGNPDFSDWVKMKMDGLFDHILVDESQDTNHQQWNIIKALTEDFFSGISASNKKRTIFIVGDEKQSIYSFQGADANISEEIFAYFSDKLTDNPTRFHKINLDNSFRSLPVILAAVDKVFAGEKEKSAITKVSDFQGHKPIRQGGGLVEIWPQIKSKKTKKVESKTLDYAWQFDFEPQQNYHEKEFLAENIALKIKQFVENKRILNGKTGPLKYSDFMILLRRRTDGFDKILSRFFYQYNIPFNSPSKTAFNDNLLIQDLLAAAKFAVANHDDLNLAALLKSPIFNLSEADIFEICLFKNSHQISFYEALQRLEKFSSCSDHLKNLIEKSQTLNCFEFFNFLLSTKNRQKIISRFGVESAEILDKFTLKIFDFCETLSPNLQKFLDFTAKLNPEISLLGDNQNRVLITTVHSAKGLQAPIVILPDCCFDSNKLRSTKEKISWIDNLPIWCAAKEDENKLLRSARELKKNQAKEEYLRLFYVALTRAEDELYIAGSGNSEDEECWYNLIKKSLEKSLAPNCQKFSFLDPETAKFAADKFEIADEILVIGEKNWLPEVESNLEFKLKTMADIAEPLSSQINAIQAELDQNFATRNLQSTAPKQTDHHKIITTNYPNHHQVNSAQIKGKLIHKILEIFGKNSAADKKWLQQLADQIIAGADFLEIAEKKLIQCEISDFLNSTQFEQIFSGKLHCEIEIAGAQTLKRIDLLVEKENEILIIDYKSDEILPPNIPPHYLTQLQNYRQLVEKIYPHKKVSTAIFWLKFLKLGFC